MKTLKTENLGKCFSLLREFIDEAQDLNNKKGVAVLALNHLQNITAGTSTGDRNTRMCGIIPRIDG